MAGPMTSLGMTSPPRRRAIVVVELEYMKDISPIQEPKAPDAGGGKTLHVLGKSKSGFEVNRLLKELGSFDEVGASWLVRMAEGAQLLSHGLGADLVSIAAVDPPSHAYCTLASAGRLSGTLCAPVVGAPHRLDMHSHGGAQSSWQLVLRKQVPLFASWDGHSKNRDTLPADWKELVASRAPAGAAYSFACMPIFQGRRLVGALALACLGSNPLAAQQDLARLDSGEDCDARATDPGVLKGPMWMQQDLEQVCLFLGQGMFHGGEPALAVRLLTATAMQSDIDGLIRAMASHLVEAARIRVHLSMSCRVALINQSGHGAALFEDIAVSPGPGGAGGGGGGGVGHSGSWGGHTRSYTNSTSVWTYPTTNEEDLHSSLISRGATTSTLGPGLGSAAATGSGQGGLGAGNGTNGVSGAGRQLVAQTTRESLMSATTRELLSSYGGPVREHSGAAHSSSVTAGGGCQRSFDGGSGLPAGVGAGAGRGRDRGGRSTPASVMECDAEQSVAGPGVAPHSPRTAHASGAAAASATAAAGSGVREGHVPRSAPGSEGPGMPPASRPALAPSPQPLRAYRLSQPEAMDSCSASSAHGYGSMNQGTHALQAVPLSLHSTLLQVALDGGVGLVVPDVAAYLHKQPTAPYRDVGISRSSRVINSLVLATYRHQAAPHPSRSKSAEEGPSHQAVSRPGMPLLGVYLSYPHSLPAQLLSGVLQELEVMLSLLGPLAHAMLHGPVMSSEWALLHDMLPMDADPAGMRPGMRVSNSQADLQAAAPVSEKSGMPAMLTQPISAGMGPGAPTRQLALTLAGPLRGSPSGPPSSSSHSLSTPSGARALQQQQAQQQALVHQHQLLQQPPHSPSGPGPLQERAACSTSSWGKGGPGGSHGPTGTQAVVVTSSDMTGGAWTPSTGCSSQLFQLPPLHGTHRRNSTGAAIPPRTSAPLTPLPTSLQLQLQDMGTLSPTLPSPPGAGAQAQQQQQQPHGQQPLQLHQSQSQPQQPMLQSSHTERPPLTSLCAHGTMPARVSAPSGSAPFPHSRNSGQSVAIGYSTTPTGQPVDLSFRLAAPHQEAGRIETMLAGLHDKLAAARASNMLVERAYNHYEDLSSLVLMESIGKGGYGTVYRALFNSTEVAVKVVPQLSDDGTAQAGRAHLRNALELAAVTAVSHPSIVQIVTFFTDVVVVELPPPPRGMPRPGPNLLLLPPASLDPALGSSPGLMQVGSLGGGTAGTAGTNCQATPSEIMTGTALDVVFESGAQAQGSQSSALHGERASACSITAALAPTSAFSAAATQPSAGGTSYGYGYGSQRGSGGGGGAGSNAGSTAFGTGAAGSPQGYGHGLNAYGFVANGGGLSLGALVAAAAAGIPTEALVPPAGLTDARGSGISSLAQQEHYRALVICMEYCDGGSLSDAVAGGAFKQRIKGGYGASVPDMLACYLTLLEIASALRHLHSLHLVHCDVKAGNVLIRTNPRDPRGFTCKLSDFGLVSILVDDGAGNMVVRGASGTALDTSAGLALTANDHATAGLAGGPQGEELGAPGAQGLLIQMPPGMAGPGGPGTAPPTAGAGGSSFMASVPMSAGFDDGDMVRTLGEEEVETVSQQKRTAPGSHNGPQELQKQPASAFLAIQQQRKVADGDASGVSTAEEWRPSSMPPIGGPTSPDPPGTAAPAGGLRAVASNPPGMSGMAALAAATVRFGSAQAPGATVPAPVGNTYGRRSSTGSQQQGPLVLGGREQAGKAGTHQAYGTITHGSASCGQEGAEGAATGGLTGKAGATGLQHQEDARGRAAAALAAVLRSAGGSHARGRRALGTPTHQAPEVITGGPAGTPIDIYAFGVLMAELVSGQPIYLGVGIDDIHRRVAAGELRPELPSFIPQDYRELAEACWQQNPQARPTAAELVKAIKRIMSDRGFLAKPGHGFPGAGPAGNHHHPAHHHPHGQSQHRHGVGPSPSAANLGAGLGQGQGGGSSELGSSRIMRAASAGLTGSSFVRDGAPGWGAWAAAGAGPGTGIQNRQPLDADMDFPLHIL